MQKNTVLIVVSKGTFDTVERASRSEKRVKWFVPDPDADTVTECYAAVELKQGLAQLHAHSRPGKALAIGFAAPEAKGSKADLRIILGTPRSNWLVRRRTPAQDLPNRSRRIRSDTPSRCICWNPEPIFGPFNC